MKKVSINAYAKINLCLDVRDAMKNGFHEVAMIMQQIGLCDRLSLSWDDLQEEGSSSDGSIGISLSTDRRDLPVDEGNLAYRAAREMIEEYGDGLRGRISIHIEKNIPMAAGLAGGSSDCAAVIHGINLLWGLGLDVAALCRIGARLGSDVPFCIMGQAAADPALKETFEDDPGKGHCAMATGRGTDLRPIKGLEGWVVLSKPDISVSTKEAYDGIDGMHINKRPDPDEMERALREHNRDLIVKNMVNVLENFTLKRYPVVVYTKDKMQEMCKTPPLMSGSGPTVFCLCDTEEEGADICRVMKTINGESFLTETTS